MSGHWDLPHSRLRPRLHAAILLGTLSKNAPRDPPDDDLRNPSRHLPSDLPESLSWRFARSTPPKWPFGDLPKDPH